MKLDTAYQKDWLLARSNISPKRVAIIFNGREYSYSQINNFVSKAVNWLEGNGFHPGDHIALLMENKIDWVILMFAIARFGATLIPINTRLTLSEILYQVEFADCNGLIGSKELLKKFEGIDKCPSAKAFEFDQLDKYSDIAVYEKKWHLSTTQAIIFTSGTTGKPKGVQLTFGNHYYSAMGSIIRLGHLPNDRWLACMPLFHVGGMAILFRGCLYGIPVILHPKFDIEDISKSIAGNKATIISLVPTMLNRMVKNQKTKLLANLRLILLGGAKTNQLLIDQSLINELPIQLTYGLTETASQVVTASAEVVKNFPGSVGKPLLFSSVEIVDEDGNRVTTNNIGEVVVSGPTVMKGYYLEHNSNGKIDTGDMGYLDEENNLWIVQRRSDLIISGGENIYPSEVETQLIKSELISQICVVGLPSKEWGQKVCAAIVLNEKLKEGKRGNLKKLIMGFGKENLAAYKIPSEILFLDKLPQTESGKIQRMKIVEIFSKKLENISASEKEIIE